MVAPVKCDICDSLFTRRSSLLRHMVRLHGVCEGAPTQNISYTSNEDNITDQDGNKCPKCFKRLSSKWYLSKHIDQCNGNANSNYSCNYCNVKFKHEKSCFRHYRICKEKIKKDAEAGVSSVTIKNHCQEANVIHNTNNTNNQTQNFIMVYNPENMEFIKDHIGESVLEYIKSVYPTIDRRIVMDYSKRILNLPENRCVKKEDLKSGYSDVHLGENKWEKMTDRHLYPRLACSLANDMSNYINDRRTKLKKEAFDKILSFIDYMSEEGYVNTEDTKKEQRILAEFNLFVKELRMIVFNRSAILSESHNDKSG